LRYTIQTLSSRKWLGLLCLCFLLNLACTVRDPEIRTEPPLNKEPSKISKPTIPASQGEALQSLPLDIEPGVVTRVIDGDTVEVLISGGTHIVRYIGIDTPETKHPRTGVECFGPEASAFNQQLVEGVDIFLEGDITDRDRYGRLLRYLWIENVGLVNLLLVQQGYARVSTYPPDVKYEDKLISAERLARDNDSGLWAKCVSSGELLNVGEMDATASPPVEGCSPHYPSICIPPYPPDLDCQQITHTRFKVLFPDPHGFDGDNNGIGCEG